MSDNQTAVIEQQVQELVNLSEDDLFRKLGVQVKQAEIAQEQNPVALAEAQAKGAFDEPEGAEMGLGENLRAFGSRWWGEIEPKIYKLLCSDESPERDLVLAQLPQSQGGTAGGDSGNKGADTIALTLAPLLIGLLPFNIPLIASVGATIAAKMLIATGLKTTCDLWQESIEEREKLKAKDAAPQESDGAPAADAPPSS